MRILRYIFLLLLLLPSVAASFDFIKCEGIGLGQTIHLSTPSASELVNLPSPFITDKSFKIDLGMNRSYDIKELDMVYLATAYRKKSITFSAGFSQLGKTDFYTEKLGKAGLAYHRNSLAAGFYVSFMSIGFGEYYESVNSLAFSFGATYFHKRYLYGILIEDINSPSFHENSEKINPKISAYGELIGKGSYSILARITMQKDENTQLGFAQKIKLSPLASLFWGISSQPGTYGGGLEINYEKSKISYAASYHPVLGLSHTVSLAYNIGHNQAPETESEF